MKCPNCQNDLAEELYEGAAIERCSDCGGVWLREKALDAIVKTNEVVFSDEERQQARANMHYDASAKKTYLCPSCSQTLVKVNYAGDTGVIVDCCPQHHGLWLDLGELEKAQIAWEDRSQHFMGFLALFVDTID